MSKGSLFIKYLFDKIMALLGMIILFPFMLIIFIIHKIVMGEGGFFFKQERIGQYGKPFKIYKIRTMKSDNNDNDVFITTANDERILPFGKFLRKTKLDEIVELVNVLKGEMSLVGPRPDVAGYADKLTGEDRKILELRPGITGPASLKYINEEVSGELFAAKNVFYAEIFAFFCFYLNSIGEKAFTGKNVFV